MATLASSGDRPPRRSRPRTDRWLSEVKGILALAIAGFGLIALATFDPSRPPAGQQSPVGPVGVWLGWAAFQSFGYAGFLFPLLLGAWGASAFVRPPVTRGVLPFTGLAVLLVSAAGLVAQASSALSHGAAERNATIAGGLVGWAVSTALRTGVGNLGAWLVLLVALPVGVLFVTRISYAAVVRVTSARLAELRRAPVAARTAAPARMAGVSAAATVAEALPEVVAPPLVVEPRSPRGRLAEQGLAWQETFDFGTGGAESFQLPPVGLLQAPPATAPSISARSSSPRRSPNRGHGCRWRSART